MKTNASLMYKLRYTLPIAILLLCISPYSAAMEAPPQTVELPDSQTAVKSLTQLSIERLAKDDASLEKAETHLPPDLNENVKKALIYNNLLLIMHPSSYKEFTFEPNGLCANPSQCAALSDNGRIALTRSSFGKMQLWDLHQVPIVPCLTLDYNFSCLALSADGAHAVFGQRYNNKALHVNLTQDPPIETFLEGHENNVEAIALSANGKYALTGSRDHTARVWDLEDPMSKPVVLIGHTKSINSVAITPDGAFALTGSFDQTARFWDLRQSPPTCIVLKKAILQDEFSADHIRSVALSSDGKTALISYGWNLTRCNPLHKPELIDLGFSGECHFSGDLRYAITRSTGVMQDLQQHRQGHLLHANGATIHAVLSPDARYALAAYHMGTARVWDLYAGLLDLTVPQLQILIKIKKNPELVKTHPHLLQLLPDRFRNNIIAQCYEDARALWRYKFEQVSELSAPQLEVLIALNNNMELVKTDPDLLFTLPKPLQELIIRERYENMRRDIKQVYEEAASLTLPQLDILISISNKPQLVKSEPDLLSSLPEALQKLILDKFNKDFEKPETETL